MKKYSIRKIILMAVAIVCLVAIILSNYFINLYKTPINLFLLGSDAAEVIDSEERDNVMTLGNELGKQIVDDSIVLLKNNNCLPLSKTKKINLFGWNATDKGFLVTGGGSGGVNIDEQLKVTLTEAFDEADVNYNKDLINEYVKFNDTYDADNSNGIAGGAEAELCNPGESFYTNDLMNSAKAFSDTAVIVISRYQKENGFTYYTTAEQGKYSNVKFSQADKNRHYLQTSSEEDAMIEKVCSNFQNVIVLLNCCNVMECGFIDDNRIDAALSVGIVGQSGAKAIPDVLFGNISPSGRTADTYAYNVKSNPSYANACYPHNIANTRYELSDDLKKVKDTLAYAENIYVGYRWYETAFAEKFKNTVAGITYDYTTEEGYNKVVQFPFGYGLSYTNFDWEIMDYSMNNTVIDETSEIEIKVRVTNTGTVEGKDVVELYYTPPYKKGGIEKSAVNLLAFQKTASLKPANLTEDGIAESQILTFKFSSYDLASYDCYDSNNNGIKGYELDTGDYSISLMESAHKPKNIASGNKINLKVQNECWIATDPSTNQVVQNKFTGDNAYAGVPTDGSNVFETPIKYLSRANFQETFPVQRNGAPTDNQKIENAASYKYEPLNSKAVKYEEKNNLYLVTKSDGSKASSAELDSGNGLKYNEELMRKLKANGNAEEWDKLLSQISMNDTLNVIRNGGFNTQKIVDLGLPRIGDSDGPTGFSSWYDASNQTMSFAFPSESTIACSWNVQNAYMVGRMQGLIGKSRGLGGWYAPCVNIHRSPFGARNFESFSEDAIISGRMSSEIIRGAKQNGMRCYLKHFAMDDNGDNPWDFKVWSTEQTIREIYLKAFEYPVKNGKANCIMSSFNRIGAVWSGSNHALLTDILRNEWGFNGTVITDASCDYMNLDRGVLAGNNLWLAGGSNPSSINITNGYSAYAARESIRSIIYTYVDTYITAKDFQDNVNVEDLYKVQIDKVLTSKEKISPMFMFLWIIINVVFIGGLICSLIFETIFILKGKKLKNNEKK